MAFTPYQTHTGLLVHVAEDVVGQRLSCVLPLNETHSEHVPDCFEPLVNFVVTITGDNIKELLRTPDEAAAVKYAESIKLHYEERAAAEKVEAEK